MITLDESESYQNQRIKDVEKRNEYPVHLAALSREGSIIGYKVDTFWTISQELLKAKVHSLTNSGPEGHLAENLIYCFNQLVSKEAFTKDTWFQRYPEGVDVSVVSARDHSEELMNYRIERNGNLFVARS
tara:strand:- start:39 stop:428 length:390 start_codon:yes stop_codon:yes gene_type:complete